MLTCPHCLHTFDPPAQDSSSSTSTSAPRCCAAATAASTPFFLAPPSPCVRVFTDSGGGLVLTSADKQSTAINPFPQPTLQLSFAQPSPSVQLSFVLPTHPSWLPQVTPPPRYIPPVYPIPSETDLLRVSSTQRALRASGWYYEDLSWQDSATTLDPCTPGTFLIRDSSDPKFIYSLSVQTTRGPTSVRINYMNGQFRLDAVDHLARFVPVFDCVLRLVEHYVELGRRKLQQQQDQQGASSSTADKGRHVWVDLHGHMYSPILLTRPKRRTVPSLQHLARIAINQRLQPTLRRDAAIPSLNLPPAIEAYLRDYPYTQ